MFILGGLSASASAAENPNDDSGTLAAALAVDDRSAIEAATRAFDLVIALEEPPAGTFAFLKKHAPRVVAATERARVGSTLGATADDAWLADLHQRIRTSDVGTLITFRAGDDRVQWTATAWTRDGKFAGSIISRRVVGKYFPWWALALVAVIGIFGGGIFLLRRTMRRHLTAYGLIAPTFVATALLLLFPIGYGIGLAFMGGRPETLSWRGFENFGAILGTSEFYVTLAVTILWTVVNVALHVALGVALALALAAPWLRLRGVYRALLILPWATPNYITALLWRGLFDYETGAINAILAGLGVAKVEWFSSFATAFTANVVTNTWLGFPFMMVMTLGALQSIPADLYEAADVDGASRVAKFRHITFPLLGPALFPAILMGSFWTFNMFNVIYLVSGGEPHGQTNILITDVYRWFKVHNQYGMAAAYSVVIFILLVVWTVLSRRIERRVVQPQ